MFQCFHNLLDLFFPRTCAICSDPLRQKEEQLCLSCFSSLAFTDFDLRFPNPVSDLFRGKIRPVKGTAFLYFQKEGSVREMIHAVKYRGRRELARFLGRLYGERLKDVCPANAVIACVPMHRAKLRKRGFNQSAEIAAGLSEVLGRRLVKDLLIKSRNTSTQTRKRRFDRWLNSELSYRIGDIDIQSIESVILVDDVLTTGSTMEACVALLFEAGIAEVWVCPLCISIH